MDSLKFSIFSKYNNINHGISSREFGSMKNEDSSINRSNLNKFLDGLGVVEEAVCMEQVHGGNVEVIDNNIELLINNADGLVTNKKNIPLCIMTADCLPILFYDAKNKVIGVAHAGRKGLSTGIIKNVFETFKDNFNSDPVDIIVGIGPGIEKKCYEVEGEFLDIRRIANEQLLHEGILKKNIENLDICTKCNKDLFYSYRGGDGTDRFATVISLI